MTQAPLPPAPDSDATIMIPRPGGRRPAAGAPWTPPGEPPSPGGTSPDLAGGGSRGADGGASLVGVNPLLAQASPLLNAVATIRRTLSHRDPAGLREELVRAVVEFEQGARQVGCRAEQVQIARYCLCTTLDEAVTLMPWGESAGWAQRSLLVSLHGETFGGEKFFQFLDQALASPRHELDLLELLYACLALGFEGRYHVMDNGRTQLTALRDRVMATIRRERGEPERDLSVHWRGVERAPQPLTRRLPAWLMVAGAALVLFVAFISYTMLLAVQSDPVFSGLSAVRADPGKYQPPVVANTPPPVPPPPRLVPLLAAEIQAGQVQVTEDASGGHIVIHSDSLFAPGRADIKPEVVPLIQRIAAVIEKVPGAVTVSGYSDNQPIRSLRFPSNFELSLERARGVAALIDAQLSDHGRTRTEGLADARPLAGNDTPEGRAKNRRVEVTLRYAP